MLWPIRTYLGTTLFRPKYILVGYMDPWGLDCARRLSARRRACVASIAWRGGRRSEHASGAEHDRTSSAMNWRVRTWPGYRQGHPAGEISQQDFCLHKTPTKNDQSGGEGLSLRDSGFRIEALGSMGFRVWVFQFCNRSFHG